MIHGVILAGGKGERLWPLTRECKPKYLLRLGARGSGLGEKSLLEQTIERIKPITKNILIITTRQQRKFITLNSKVKIISEPHGRNTANAIRLAAQNIVRKDPDGIMVVLPADHIISKKDRFYAVLNNAIRFIKNNHNALVTIGIKPVYPATGYGYIRINPKSEIRNPKCYKVERFVEKPDIKKANRFIRAGNYLWNSGMFVWKARTILKDIKRYNPDLLPISIDYAVLEKAKDVYAVRGNFDWCDVGSLNAIEKVQSAQRAGKAQNIGIDTQNCVIIGGRGHLIGTIGISGLVIVHTDDATLVCPKDRAQDVKILVEEIKKRRLRKYL